MTDTPTLNGQILGQAQRAAGAVFARTLAAHHLEFEQWVLLLTLTNGGGSMATDELVAEAAAALRVDREEIEAVVASLVRAERLAPDGDRIEPTDTGRTLVESVQADAAVIAGRLYGDLPAEDRETTARVLLTLTERANAELSRA